MSDKKSLLAAEEKTLKSTLANSHARKTLIESMPDGFPVPGFLTLTGYCADATLVFESGSEFEQIADAFPPAPCVRLLDYGISIKPAEYVRPEDGARKREVYPITHIIKGTAAKAPVAARWWSRLAGQSVLIEVMGVSLTQIGQRMGSESSRYFFDSYPYATGRASFWQLRQKGSEELKLLSPLEAWSATWHDWAIKMRFDQKQIHFISIYRHWVRYADAENASSVLNLPERTPPAGDRRHWERMCDFWNCFTEEQAATLVAFMKEQQVTLAQCKQEAVQGTIEAEAWFKAFFSTRGNPFVGGSRVGCTNMAMESVTTFDYLFHKETGLAGNINWVSDKAGEIEVGYTLDKEHIRVQCRYRGDAPAIDWEALAEFH